MIDIPIQDMHINGYFIEAPIMRNLIDASLSTGVSLKYLMAKAAGESSFDPNCKAKTSSATGIFQFTNQTWLEMMARYGSEFGHSDEASCIFENNNVYTVADEKKLKTILDLRKDAKLSSLMAAAFARENYNALKVYLKRQPYASELYLAHFLGSKGALQLLCAIDKNSNTKAYTIMPEQARANPGVFYTSRYNKTNKTARSVLQTYNYIREYFRSQFFAFEDIARQYKLMSENATKPSADRIELKPDYTLSGKFTGTFKNSDYSIETTEIHSFKI